MPYSRFPYAIMLLIGTPAIAAQTATSVAAPGKAPDSTATEKRICRRLVPTGSMMAKRICLTTPEWRTFYGLGQGDAETTLRRRGSGMCDVGAGSCLNRQ